MVEIFSNRMEITNPGLPLVKTDRFLDSPPKSSTEALASFMRRIGVCEERGSGVIELGLPPQTELTALIGPGGLGSAIGKAALPRLGIKFCGSCCDINPGHLKLIRTSLSGALKSAASRFK